MSNVLDRHDLRDLRAAKSKEADAPTMSFSEAAKRYGTKKNKNLSSKAKKAVELS